MKNVCVICGAELSIWNGQFKLSDGVLCRDCIMRTGLGFNENITKTLNTAAIRQLIEQQSHQFEYDSRFVASADFGEIAFDDKMCLVRIKKLVGFHHEFKYYKYNQIANYELLENGSSVTKSKGTIGRAVVGGLLFGGIGAIVGGATSKRTTNTVCNSLKLMISFTNNPIPTDDIKLISGEVSTSSQTYSAACDKAQKIIFALQQIIDSNATPQISSSSPADEILKYKRLLDEGIITVDEFNQKKKQLLGM